MQTNVPAAKNQIMRQIAPLALLSISLGVLLTVVPPLYAIAALATLGFLAFAAARPEIGVLAIIVLISSIVFEEALPLIPIGIGSFHVSDIILLSMLCLIPVKWMIGRNGRFIGTPLDIPLLLFFAIALVSAYLSISHYGMEFNSVARMFRAISYYLLFFVITNHLREKRQVEFLIRGLFVVATIVAAAMLMQAVVGEAVKLMPGRVENAETFHQEYDVLRILPPGQTLLYVFFLTTLSYLANASGRSLFSSRYFYLLLVIGSGVMLTYNRSFWVAIGMSILIYLAIASSRGRKRTALLMATGLMLIMMMAAIFGTLGGKYQQVYASVSERFTSLFTGKKLKGSSSLEDRRTENEYALVQIKRHPVLGTGLASHYRPNIYGRDDFLHYYVHNCYLWIMKDMGVTGLLVFMWFYLGFIIRGFKHRKKIRDERLRSAVTGFMLAGIGILPMALYVTVYMEWFSIVVLATMIGLTEAIIRINATDEEIPCQPPPEPVTLPVMLRKRI